MKLQKSTRKTTMNAIKTRYIFFLSYQFEPSISIFLVSGRSCSTGVGIRRRKLDGNISCTTPNPIPFCSTFPGRTQHAGDVSRPSPCRFCPLAVPGTGDGTSMAFPCFRVV
ncbi:hypothetical protein Hdeb2414_s0026g00675971 [Helianthus debilis subsp. tardiflorus]